jgi:hypothetical protein
MSTLKQERAVARREAWGRLRKLPSGRWQVRYPAPDGKTYTARTDDNRPLTFQTKTDARAWLAATHAKIATGQWEQPEIAAARRQAAAAEEAARSIGFREYADRWMTMIRETPNRSGKMRAAGTIRDYKGKVEGYLVPEFGDTPVREIDAERSCRACTTSLVQPSRKAAVASATKSSGSSSMSLRPDSAWCTDTHSVARRPRARVADSGSRPPQRRH